MAKFSVDFSGFDDFMYKLEHFEVDCPECQHPFEISINDTGKTVTCPHCGSKIKIESE